MHNLRAEGRILYISSFDVSIGNGPGVNEREFTISLFKVIGNRAHFLMPRPVFNVTGLPDDVCTYSSPHHGHRVSSWINHVISQSRQAIALLTREQFDLIVYRLDLLPFTQYYIKRRFSTPFVIKTLGQGLVNTLFERGGIAKVFGYANLRMVREVVEQSLVADCVNPIAINYLQDKLRIQPDKIVWIDNAVNTERFFPTDVLEARREIGLERFNPIVGYVGTRPWERGGSQLIEATPSLLSRYPDLGIVILGDGSGLEWLKRRAKALGIADRCLFAGLVPFESVPTYINAMNVGVSINDRKDRERASELKVRQYIACGKPAIASPGGSNFLAETGLGSLVKPDDLDSLVVTLKNWLDQSPRERSDFLRHAVIYAHDHLSTDIATNTRLQLWSERLENE